MRFVGTSFLVFLSCLGAAGQEAMVSNITFSQSPAGSGTQADIYYDLDSPGGACTVTAYLSRDGGATFPAAIASVTGDAGPGVAPGTGKHIVWNIAADCPNETITRACIRLVADVLPAASGYGVGTHDIFYSDPSRGGRSVAVRVRYPAQGSGPDAPIAGEAGTRFPVVVFGHGWLTPVSDYTYLWNLVVPAGYIMVMVDTETGVNPDQDQFARDEAFVVDSFRQENGNPASFFYGKVADAFATSGHSMGGGAAIISVQYSTNIRTIVTLAAADNSAPVVDQSIFVTKPALMIAGASDCMAVPSDHSIPMYNAMPSVCKYYVSIVRGSHCQFCEDSTNCKIAQTGLCLGRSYVDRGTQEAVTGAVMIHWLDAKLKGLQSRWLQWESGLGAYAQANLITYTSSCTSAGAAQSGVGLLDTVSPTGAILVNSNQSVTNNAAVTLGLTWEDGAGVGVAKMRFSDDGAHWTVWETAKNPRTYTLPEPDGYHTVRVQYRDAAGNRSPTYNDYIRLDRVPPTGTILINGGALTTITRAVTLGLTWSDGAGSGVVRMRFSDDGAHWTLWEPMQNPRAYTLPEGLGYHTVRVQYRDGGGNVSPAYNDYIKLVAPS